MHCRLQAFELDRAPRVPELLSQLRARRAVAALDSAGGEPSAWSLVAFDPVSHLAPPVELAGLRAFARALEIDADVPGPFQGGFIGALSYDLGVHGERAVPATDPWRSPRVVGGLYTDFVVRDERAGRAWLVLGDDALDGRPSLAARRAEIRSLLDARESAGATPLGTSAASARAPRPLGPLVRWTGPELHRARIERLRERIAAGDLYQANLAHRFTRRIAGDPIDLYLRLRGVNPAPYAAFLAWDESTAHAGASGKQGFFRRGAILSASPELLLEFRAAEGIARTRPIKGTMPRGRDPIEDEQNAKRLLSSAKDRAELAMIVDLERNDLGRCARAGGVRVERFPHLETYAGVHHLAADVVADVRDGLDAFDLLAALFPGGSVTGAPKLAAIDAIHALEGEGRGFFTGSLGFVDARGNACWNILIRTIVWRPLADADEGEGRERVGEASYHVGGGITWPSDPALEEAETLHKGARLALALEAPPQPGRTREGESSYGWASEPGQTFGPAPAPELGR